MSSVVTHSKGFGIAQDRPERVDVRRRRAGVNARQLTQGCLVPVLTQPQESRMPEPTSPTPPPERLSLRWALILLAAVVAGLLAGLLTYAQSRNWPASILAALGASGAALVSLPLLL